MMTTELPMDLGPQPLEAFCTARSLSNHDIVAAAGEPAVTHKVVNKARKGRQLTARMQKKVYSAVNTLLAGRGEERVNIQDLFNYIGR